MPVFNIEVGLEYLVFDDYNYIKENISSIQYKDTEMPTNHVLSLIDSECTSAKGIEPKRLLELAVEAHNKGICLNFLSAKKLAKLEHKSKTSSFLDKYSVVGLTKCKEYGSKQTEKELEELFEKEKRFHGRTPRILSSIAAVCDFYNIPTETAVNKFAINAVRTLLNRGIPEAEVVLLYTQLNDAQISKISDNYDVSQMVSTMFDKALRKNKKGQFEEAKTFYNAAVWIADHAESDLKLLKKVYSRAENLKLDEKVTVDNIRVQFSNNKALNEVARIEKAYKKCGFKLKNCTCELHKTTSETSRYKARILKGDDPRQVMLGYDTDCCQHLGEAGESAMMHGLLHPKAGFWVVTKIDSGKVVAQAEVWELNENTLVFDNIEFANDAEIDQYKEIIGKWVKESRYSNIIMGCGYNSFNNDSFEYAGAVIPPVTPYEIYVLSYEDDAYARDEICELESEEKARELLERGEVTYFDYVYCDSENTSVYLKKDGRISEFFEICDEQQLSLFDTENDYEEEIDF